MGDPVTRGLTVVEEHFADAAVIAAIARRRTGPAFQTSRELEDTGAGRLAYMDANGIERQVLSYPPTLLRALPGGETVALHRLANDALAERVARRPDRFSGLAALPMARPEEAARELERCVRDLGLCGAMLYGTGEGAAYDAPACRAVFAAAETLGVPVSLHPAPLPETVQAQYFRSEALSPAVNERLAGPGFGWHAEAGLMTIRLILSGLFRDHPGLAVLSGHWGELVPAFLDRLDRVLPVEVTGLPETVSAYYRRHVWLTPGGILSPVQLDLCRQVVGSGHILYALDWPYVRADGARTILDRLPPDEREAIAWRSADALLGGRTRKMTEKRSDRP